ncbi:MAG TPA: hypothetical protein VGG98_04365 [Solirubrobacteraceae bacterium]
MFHNRFDRHRDFRGVFHNRFSRHRDFRGMFYGRFSGHRRFRSVFRGGFDCMGIPGEDERPEQHSYGRAHAEEGFGENSR